MNHLKNQKQIDDREALVSDAHKAQRASMTRAAKPKLASTILLVRGERGSEQVLMGLRSKKHDFMPDIHVFPGGRVDPCDSYARAADNLNARTRTILEAAMSPSRARACVMASIRETFEETGFVIGEPSDGPAPKTRNASWAQFYATRHRADLSSIHVIGRAVTPPYRPKRFDTWFFMTRLTDAQAERPFYDSEELLETQWVSIGQKQKQTDGLKMHPITQMMLEVLDQYLSADTPAPHIPYTRHRPSGFVQDDFPKALKQT